MKSVWTSTWSTRTERCSCGGLMHVERAAIGAGVRAHRETAQHQIWVDYMRRTYGMGEIERPDKARRDEIRAAA